MRRFNALLFTAGLAAAPVSAAAGPCPASDRSTDQSMSEKFEWSTSKGRLGVLVMGLTPELRKHFSAAEDCGVMVARVEPSTPAAMAGIKPGDIVTEVRGHMIDRASDIVTSIAEVAKEQPVAIKLVRDGKPLEFSVKLTAEPVRWFDPHWDVGWLHEFLKPFTQPGHPTTIGT